MNKKAAVDDWIPLVTITIVLALVLMIFFVNAKTKADQDKYVANEIFNQVDYNINLLNFMNYNEGRVVDLVYQGLQSGDWQEFESIASIFFQSNYYNIKYQIQVFRGEIREHIFPVTSGKTTLLGDVKIPDITSSGVISVRLYELDTTGPTGGVM